MIRVLVVSALALSLSCNFAVKHPAITAGVVAGTTGLVTCELASEDHKPCFIAGGAVGVGLALVAAFALWLGSEDEPAAPATSEPPPQVDWDKVPDTTPKEPTKAPPLPDAGVPDAPPADAPPPGDAGAPASDAR
jgi:type IV secretory pathway VirB10-like protein